MTSKHTPGPWNVEDETPFSLWVSCPDGKNPLHQNRLNRDRLANARLMAASPDLLEALRIALEVMSSVDGENNCSRGINAAEYAIAKATGQ